MRRIHVRFWIRDLHMSDQGWVALDVCTNSVKPTGSRFVDQTFLKFWKACNDCLQAKYSLIITWNPAELFEALITDQFSMFCIINFSNQVWRCAKTPHLLTCRSPRPSAFLVPASSQLDLAPAHAPAFPLTKHLPEPAPRREKASLQFQLGDTEAFRFIRGEELH
jgi:hypothetical protein